MRASGQELVLPMVNGEKDRTPDDVPDHPDGMQSPMAPDPARADRRELIRNGDVIWGLTPEGTRHLLYAQVNGVRRSFRDVCEGRLPWNARIIELPCASTNGLAQLRELVRKIKQSRDVRRRGSRFTDHDCG